MNLLSPTSGTFLAQDTPHSLAASGERWPIVGGIPYLRRDRQELVGKVLASLDAGDADEATAQLLTDQDEWWTGPVASIEDCRQLVRMRDELTLREAMALLKLGPVADYFAYRWSDPTYLAGLALIEAHWNSPDTAFELACGIGHYLRELGRLGVHCTGADIVFAKCWLAKQWIAPEASYLVFDAASEWPVCDERYDLVMCHDAFYFLPEQEKVAAAMRAITADEGVLTVGHLHNADVAGGALGPARSAEEWQQLFSDARVYDERELLRAFHTAEAPANCDWAEDGRLEAWSVVEGYSGDDARSLANGLTMPPNDAQLVANPLLSETEGKANWPSSRYEQEYARASLWAKRDEDVPYSDPVRLRRLVDLPERW
ncbi:methyltransferase domain-containing protein [Altererythrobacter aurantiacus]|uniref:Methyltransferase domain-containing protein n=1 Tax=Parapontixanthobacter aurantiacus TaxID=1463599 RepID=A0A844ZG56_9SPHN|nr:class I SAM-dependent methyltransferase [Parapontixanthobacter aurantiacus]MXO86534.1 methyltransferase domain-containing protein [Parapontixanthobacter aurantiacus]